MFWATKFHHNLLCSNRLLIYSSCYIYFWWIKLHYCFVCYNMTFLTYLKDLQINTGGCWQQTVSGLNIFVYSYLYLYHLYIYLYVPITVAAHKSWNTSELKLKFEFSVWWHKCLWNVSCIDDMTKQLVVLKNNCETMYVVLKKKLWDNVRIRLTFAFISFRVSCHITRKVFMFCLRLFIVLPQLFIVPFYILYFFNCLF